MNLDTVKFQEYSEFMPRTDLPVPRKRKSYHHGDLRRALVEAALSLLTKTQRWDFSLREVARRANVSHNAPYSHFASKRDLLGAVAVKGYEILRARLLSALRGKAKPADALKAISIAYLRFATENPAHYRLMFGPTLPSFVTFNPAYAQVQNEHVWAVAWADIIKGGMTPQAAAEKAFKRVEEIFAKYPIAQS